MARVQRTYESIVRGVSQQVPQDRREGQMWEQVNLISDPVLGLTRRRGSIMRDEQVLMPYSPAVWARAVGNTERYKTSELRIGSEEYVITYPTRAKLAGTNHQPLLAYNKQAMAFAPVVSSPSDALVQTLLDGGVSAATAVGRYVFLAGRAIVPNFTIQDLHGTAANRRQSVIWVRGGAYSRTYQVTMRQESGAVHTVAYTTPSSSYPHTLDTTGIATADPDYTKKVNDLVNAYNSAVTQWIGAAAAAIQPDAIAEQLRVQLAGVGFAVVRSGSHVYFTDAAQVTSLTSDDGGDNSHLRTTAQEVTSPELVTQRHFIGKVVRVQPRQGGRREGYYLQATAKIDGATGFGEVVWREAAGEIQTPTGVLVFVTAHNGTIYMGSTKAFLDALIPSGTHPTYIPSRSGDTVSVEPPHLFGRRISFLTTLQDRLVIGSEGVLLMSRPGDYLNFYRDSMLTLADDDPIEIYSIGSEADTIRSSVMYDRNMIIFGDQRQYSVPGRAPITPTSAVISVQSNYKGSTTAYPVAVGNLVFYPNALPGKRVTLHQIQMGALQDTPESFNVAQQLTTYLRGDPVEIEGMSNPNFVVLRTAGYRNGLYLYTYLDTPAGEQRLFDSWSRWHWEEGLGVGVSINLEGSDLNVVMLRHDGVNIYYALESFSMETSDTSVPHLDSLRPWTNVPKLGWMDYTDERNAVAWGGTHPLAFLGLPADRVGEALAVYGVPTVEEAWIGREQIAYCVPTNPFIRDRNDRAELSGRLTVNKVNLTVADTGGFDAFVQARNTERQATSFSGRAVGLPSSAPGQQPLTTKTVPIPVALETREYKLYLFARTWVPFVATSIDWAGQLFRR